jgi:hypothetical protein
MGHITVAHLGTSQAAWIFSSAPTRSGDLLAYSLVSHLTFMLANGTFGVLFCQGIQRSFLRDRTG